MLPAALAFAGCNDDNGEGGGDDSAAGRPMRWTEAEVRDLAESKNFGKQQREAVFEALGATPLSSRKALSNPDPKHPNRKRIRFVCYRFRIEGGHRELRGALLQERPDAVQRADQRPRCRDPRQRSAAGALRFRR